MFYKPKHTYLDQPALHYKKVIDIALYTNTSYYYYHEKYVDGILTGFYYVFDREKENFIEIDSCSGNRINIIPIIAVYKYNYTYFGYDGSKWITLDYTPENYIEIYADKQYKNQKNTYVKDRYFDYTIISDINENEEQVIKGLITPTKSFDIKYTDDDININDDDIVQIGNELFFVSESSYRMIRLPKPFKTYFCTLTRLKV